MLRRFSFALLLLTAFLPKSRADASAEAWFQPPSLVQPALAPDGQRVAALRWTGSGRELVVFPASNPNAPVQIPAPEPGRAVADFVWLGADELAFLTLAADGTGNFWRARADGTGFAPLMPHEGPGAAPAFIRFLRPQPAVPGRVMLEGVARAELRRGQPARWLDVFAAEPASGLVTLAASNPGDVGQWLADDSGAVRVALAVRGRMQELRVFGPAASNGGNNGWRTVTAFEFARDPAALLGLSPDGRRAWIAARLGRDTTGVHELDVVAGRFTRTLWSNDEFDFAGGVFVLGGSPLALAFDALKPATTWFNPGWAEQFRQLEAAAPNFAWQPVSFSADGQRAVMAVISDRQPTRFAVVNRDAIGAPSWLPGHERTVPTAVGAMQPVRFTTRDGPGLTGYLTRPAAANGPGPLLVLAHGGPWARDIWGWRPEVQFLASRGWTVLQVNYRGSAGFGWRFQEAGAGRWGTGAVNDLVDGARWTVAQGVASPAQIAVAGTSFGGWLTLAALEREPELFRAGASVGGVFDLRSWLRYAAGQELPFVVAAQREWLLGAVGDPWRPFAHLGDLRRPLLLVHAADDRSVPAQQSVALAEALRRAGKAVEFWRLPHGGHTLDSPTAQAETWTRVDEFLTRAVPMLRR